MTPWETMGYHFQLPPAEHILVTLKPLTLVARKGLENNFQRPIEGLVKSFNRPFKVKGLFLKAY